MTCETDLRLELISDSVQYLVGQEKPLKFTFHISNGLDGAYDSHLSFEYPRGMRWLQENTTADLDLNRDIEALQETAGPMLEDIAWYRQQKKTQIDSETPTAPRRLKSILKRCIDICRGPFIPKEPVTSPSTGRKRVQWPVPARMISYFPFLWRRDQQYTQEEADARAAKKSQEEADTAANKRKIRILQRPKKQQQNLQPKVPRQVDRRQSLEQRQANYDRIRARIFGAEKPNGAGIQPTAPTSRYKQYLQQAKEDVISAWRAICPCVPQKERIESQISCG